MAKTDDGAGQKGAWLQIFSNSKVNGAAYRGDDLPAQTWAWPADTFLQRRRQQLRNTPADTALIVAQNPSASSSRLDARLEDFSAYEPEAIRPVRPRAVGTEPSNRAHDKGLVIEWDDLDERLAGLAKPNSN